MFGLKKQLIKSFIKLDVVENKPGLLKIQILKLSDLDKKYRTYEGYVLESIKCLEGIQEATIDYTRSIIVIGYNQHMLTPQKIYRWMQVLLDVSVENLELIQRYWETDRVYVKERLDKVLKSKLQLMNQ